MLSKTDALFATPEEARAALTDDVLRSALGPLVQLIEQSEHVSDAAIIPVTAFGFGKAVLRDGRDRAARGAGVGEEPFGDEPIWLLKEGESPRAVQPRHAVPLVAAAGPAEPGDGRRTPKLDTLCRMLRDDLEAGDPWLVPIKGGVALATP